MRVVVKILGWKNKEKEEDEGPFTAPMKFAEYLVMWAMDFSYSYSGKSGPVFVITDKGNLRTDDTIQSWVDTEVVDYSNKTDDGEQINIEILEEYDPLYPNE